MFLHGSRPETAVERLGGASDAPEHERVASEAPQVGATRTTSKLGQQVTHLLLGVSGSCHRSEVRGHLDEFCECERKREGEERG